MIVSSILFGLMHFIPSIGAISLNELCLQSIQYVLAGIAFCLVYIKRGNVLMLEYGKKYITIGVEVYGIK